MKFILMFFILAILIWGFTGLTFKDAILFTSVGLSISVVALSALLVVALTFVMAAMYAAHELGALGKMIMEGANKQVISSQADSLIKISRIWADFFPANTSNQPI